MLVKLLTRCALPVAGIVFLCSCSSLHKTPPPPPLAIATTTGVKTERGLRTRAISTDQQQPTAVKISPRSEQITQLVRAGSLIETSRECLIFSQTRAPKTVPGGLFEDAIVLGRLRGQLKKIAGLPESVAGTATVQGARAYLKLSDQITAELAARAIDSALKTEGVSVVHVTTAPEARL